MSENHCIDCCCAQSWKALGITEYTEKSIPEHIELLQQQIEDMKCCGNCNGSYTTPNDACFCARYLKPTNAGYYCKAWQSDGQTRKEREIETAPWIKEG